MTKHMENNHPTPISVQSHHLWQGLQFYGAGFSLHSFVGSVHTVSSEHCVVSGIRCVVCSVREQWREFSAIRDCSQICQPYLRESWPPIPRLSVISGFAAKYMQKICKWHNWICRKWLIHQSKQSKACWFEGLQTLCVLITDFVLSYVSWKLTKLHIDHGSNSKDGEKHQTLFLVKPVNGEGLISTGLLLEREETKTMFIC